MPGGVEPLVDGDPQAHVAALCDVEILAERAAVSGGAGRVVRGEPTGLVRELVAADDVCGLRARSLRQEHGRPQRAETLVPARVQWSRQSMMRL